MRRRKRRNNWLWLLPVLLIAGSIGGYFAYQNYFVEEEAVSTEPSLQTATVRQGEILVSAIGAGTIVPATTTELAFTTSGILQELNVRIGDTVQTGDILARLENSDLEKAVADAELAVLQAELQLDEDAVGRTVELAEIQVRLAELSLAAAAEELDDLLAFEPDDNSIAVAQAELNLRNAQNNLQRVYNNANSSDLDIRQAQLNLNSAQTDLNNLYSEGADEGTIDLQQAQLNVQTAQRDLDDLLNFQPDWDEVGVLQANYQSAVENLNSALARAELTDDELVQSRVNLEQAQANLVTRQEEWDSAYDEARQWERNIETTRERADSSLEAAQQQLEIAQANYNIALVNSDSAATIASAQAGVQNAQQNLNQAQQPPDENTIQAARDNLYAAQLQLQQTQNGIDASVTGYNNTVSNAQVQVEQQAIQLQITQENANLADANYSTDVVAAQISVQQAELSLQEVQNSMDDDSAENLSQVAAAQRSVEQAELALRQAQINLIETSDKTQAELSLRQSQINLETAIAKAEQILLVSPVSGTVTAVDAQVGASVGTTGIIAVSNLEETVVEIFFDETDIDKVTLGNEIEINFDAIPEETFTGQIILIDPQLVVDGGVTTVRAEAVVEQDFLGSGAQLTVGMNATVEVISGRATNALIVPVEALRELSPGNFSVFVLEDGEPRLRVVEVGLVDLAFAEITAGLAQGDVVTTGIVETE